MKSSKGDDWLDKKLEHAEPGEIVAGVRPDATFNRIDKHIRNAAMQLDAVNPKRDVPNVLVFVNNVLVFVNHDIRGVPSDLEETITGCFPAEDGSRIPTVPRVAQRAQRGVCRIDLCIWINARRRAVESLIFNTGNEPDHTAFLKELFRALHEKGS